MKLGNISNKKQGLSTRNKCSSQDIGELGSSLCIEKIKINAFFPYFSLSGLKHTGVIAGFTDG